LPRRWYRHARRGQLRLAGDIDRDGAATSLVLVGPDWHAMYESWCAHMVPMEHLFEPLTLVDTPAAAADFLREWFAPLSEGDSAGTRSTGTDLTVA